MKRLVDMIKLMQLSMGTWRLMFTIRVLLVRLCKEGCGG
jgi:esterase/lipase superfamily enzyme